MHEGLKAAVTIALAIVIAISLAMAIDARSKASTADDSSSRAWAEIAGIETCIEESGTKQGFEYCLSDYFLKGVILP